jgi:hypothetical protein
MPAKLTIGTLFLGITVGSATFLVAGFALFLAIGQLQYRTIQARATQAATEVHQVSIRAKNAPVMFDTNDRRSVVSIAP